MPRFERRRRAVTRLAPALAVALLACSNADSQLPPELILIDGESLGPNLDLGVDSGAERRDWVSAGQGHVRLQYPANQHWGAITLVFGIDAPGTRPTEDLSAYETLQVQVGGSWRSSELELLAQGVNGKGEDIKSRRCIVAAHAGGDTATLSVPWHTLELEDERLLARVFSPLTIVLLGDRALDLSIEQATLFREGLKSTSCVEAP